MANIFSDIGETLFGDQGKGAAEAQGDENAANRRFIQEQTKRARADIAPLFGEAQQARISGTQGALDVLGGALPAQLDVFNRGNISAQNVLAQGVPQFENALLGIPQDFSFNQQNPLAGIDLSFLNQQLPEFQTGGEILGKVQAQINQRKEEERLAAEQLAQEQALSRSLGGRGGNQRQERQTSSDGGGAFLPQSRQSARENFLSENRFSDDGAFLPRRTNNHPRGL